MSRPTMRFVAVKTAQQQASLMLAGTRERLVARRTQLGNVIRGYAAEFGLIAAKGTDKIEPLLGRIAAEPAGRRWRASCSPSMARNTGNCRPNWRTSRPG
jgi:transposase